MKCVSFLDPKKFTCWAIFGTNRKGSPRSLNLPSSLKLSCDRDLKVLNASKSSEKSKGFFLGQLCNLSGIFFLDQRSTVREIENLKQLIRPSPGVLDPRSNKNPAVFTAAKSRHVWQRKLASCCWKALLLRKCDFF